MNCGGERLRARISSFLTVLRDNGFQAGLGELGDALRVMTLVDLGRPVALRSALRCLLCACRDDWQRFDELFDAFWLGRGMRRVAKVTDGPAGRPLRRSQNGMPGGPAGIASQVERGDDSGAGSPAEGSGRRAGASRAESLAETDLRQIAEPEALAEAHRLAERLARRMRSRLTRRTRRRAHGRRLDLRRTIHRSIAHGGTPLSPAWRRRREKPLRLVLLLDVSGSMSQYSAFFVRFLHGVLGHFREADAFIFHTRLIHVSPALAEPDPVKAVERLSLLGQGWSGGTRIGASLADFNRWHAPRAITSRTAVIIVSDGYDTGAPAALAEEMAALRRRTRRIAWLNPMIGWPGYQPTAGGMAAALPYLDLFAPAHNLKSLAALEPYLARL